MPDANDSEDRPAEAPEPDSADASTAHTDIRARRADDARTPVHGVPGADVGTSASGVPLSDEAFPGFDASRVPPRPPLPSDAQGGTVNAARPVRAAEDVEPATGEHSAIREHWRARRDELESHVSQARDQLESHVSQARDHFDQANERIKERTGRDLILAIVIGVAFGAAFVASLLFVKWLFVPIALAAGLLGTYELSRALRTGGRRVDAVPQLIAATGVVLAGVTGEFWISWVVLIVAVSFIAVWRMLAQMVAKDGRTYGDVLADVVTGGFVQIYVPFLASLAIMLLFRENGEWWVLTFVSIAVAADTFAYATGLAFGKHPMAPRISPKKTWEGFAGAVLGSLTVGVLLAVYLLHLEWWCGLILGAAILLSATLGDLAESLLKRDLGIKDMSSWLPGHGGLLDRLDSILPSTVPALALSFLLTPWMVS
ncbi:phosphatidate cytidylyltransferase [Microbacterium soli]|uniref:Phosphatidate cytidylyltransferase n=1 Tax=Microbacterium soli TaxID=446075 RepID=A0ABP7NFH5_9MICO